MGKRYGTTLNIDTFEYLDNDASILGQAVDMRLSTRPGTYFKEPLYGLAVEELLGESYDAAAGPRLGARIAAEVSEDDRILGATATVDAGGSFVVQIEPDDGDSFDLTGSIDDIRPALERTDADEGA